MVSPSTIHRSCTKFDPDQMNIILEQSVLVARKTIGGYQFLCLHASRLRVTNCLAEEAKRTRPRSEVLHSLLGKHHGRSERSAICSADSECSPQVSLLNFLKINHSITETSLEDPCTALPGKSSFDSGFISVSMNATEYPTQILTVNTLKPIYFACVQKMHCELGIWRVLVYLTATKSDPFQARDPWKTSNPEQKQHWRKQARKRTRQLMQVGNLEQILPQGKLARIPRQSHQLEFENQHAD
ncbi:hypothetical protein VP01_244g4 [Puccinia sorghi]|uniref:Uncharacterized protein n=1 Tax=Puccinia sorghi TaxID=27349 RepID=A0A0L6V6U2_9BASI|nr:hypothetical protein VP01_244g4 [Puccinia sorghi]